MPSRLLTLTVFSGSTRKVRDCCPRVALRANISSTALRPSFRYCSIWSLEMNCDAPSVSKVPPPPSAGRVLASIRTPVRYSMLFRYSRRLRRRIVISPPESESERRAVTRVLARSSRKSAFSSPLGCFLSSGGISPEFIELSTFCQSSASGRVAISKGRNSRFTSPFSVSASWQVRQ